MLRALEFSLGHFFTPCEPNKSQGQPKSKECELKILVMKDPILPPNQCYIDTAVWIKIKIVVSTELDNIEALFHLVPVEHCQLIEPSSLG